MSKLGWVCGLILVVAALGCGDDDGGSGAAGVSGGNSLCEQQTARAMNECGVTAGGGTSDAGTVACTGQTLCIAQCSQAATCADLMAAQQGMGPFIPCSIACFQQPAP